MATKSPHKAKAARGKSKGARLRKRPPFRPAHDQFLSRFCHEIRSPLTAIMLWSRALRAAKSADDELREAVAAIERSAKLQSDLIDEALELLRLASGRIQLNRRALELAAIVNEVAEAARAGAEGKSVTITTDLPRGAVVVRADPGRLRQVIRKLLANAVRFSSGGGRIAVSLRRSGQQIRLKIADRGRGIDGQSLPGIFEVLDPSRPDAGLRLGLAIVRRLVELHDGTIGVHSGGLGKGSIFTIELPQAVVGASGAGDFVQPSAGPFGQSSLLAGVRALVVESRSDTRNMIQWMLEQSGADVTAVASARQALESFAGDGSRRPDILVGADGAANQQLLKRIRAAEPTRVNGNTLPAIVISEKDGKNPRRRALKAGYQDLIAKPINPDQLVAAAARLTGRGQAG